MLTVWNGGLYLHESARVRILENGARLSSFISPVSRHGDVYDGFLGYPLVHEPEYFPFKFWKKPEQKGLTPETVWVDEVGEITPEMIERLSKRKIPPLPGVWLEKGGSIFGELLKGNWCLDVDRPKNKAP